MGAWKSPAIGGLGFGGLLVLAALLSVTSAEAAIKYDLTTTGASVTVNGAIYTQVSPQPTGTGYIDPFVRLQAKGTEQGYNTSYRPVQFDEKTVNGSLNYTHDLPLANLSTVTKNGTSYFEFLLDINEANNSPNNLLSLDRVQIFVSPTASLHDYQFTNGGKTGTLTGATLVYSLDGSGGTPDNYVLLNYSLNSGSGSGDMLLDVPTSVFPSCAGCYLYLYSKFGEQDTSGTSGAGSDAGFEEWTAKGTNPLPPTSVPQPWSLLLVAPATIGLGFWRNHRKADRS